MSTQIKSLLLGGLSVLVLSGTINLAGNGTAEARTHRSGKKTDGAADSAQTGADAAPDKAGAKPDAGQAPAAASADKPAATPAPAPTPPASSGAKANVGVSVGAGPVKAGVSVGAAAQAPAPPPAPAAAPKELAPEVSGPKQEAARAHFEKGVELYTQGDFPNAWLEFNSAYQLVPLIDLLNNVARCEVRMGRPSQALEHFQRFIAARPNDQDSEYIRQEIARLEGELGRNKTAAAAPQPDQPAPPPAPRRVPIYGLMTGATTLALVIAGAVTLGTTNSSYNDLQVRCSPMCYAEDVAVLQRQSYAGYGLLGVAAAGAAVTGIVLYFELRSSKETSLRPLARLGIGANGVLGRF